MAKLELIHISGQSYYCSGRLSVGVYLAGNRAILIDTGIDEASAKSIDKALQSIDCKPIAIINTHGHADHCGGNEYFQQKYPDIAIYASTFEQHYIEDPANEPRCFCSGAAATIELQNKFLQAAPSRVTHPVTPYIDQDITIENLVFRLITLPGHTDGMLGIITPDQVLYCGDAVFGEATNNKHSLLFYTDIQQALETIQKLQKLNVKAYSLYHGGLAAHHLALLEASYRKITWTADEIHNLICMNNAISIDELTSMLMMKWEIPENIVQFVLSRTCINAYIAYLQMNGRIKISMQHCLMVASSTTCT